MKIVFIAPFGIRPKGTLIARMLPIAVEMQSRGHNVVIVAPPYTNPEDSGKVEAVRGVKLINISLSHSNKMLATPILSWRLFRAALKEKPDLIHLFKPKGYGGMAAILHIFLQCIGRRLPLLFVDTDDWEGHGGMSNILPYTSLERIIFQFQEDWIPQHAKGITVASRTLQTKIWGMGMPQERVLYIPNCADETPLGNGSRVREKLGIPPDALVVLLYTRFFEFSQEKLYFLFDNIYRKAPGVRFLIVGKGRNNEEERLEKAGKERGFGPALVMAGWIEIEELPDYLASGDVAIYPFADTLINRAKCPAKLTDLLRGELAVVADNVGQIAEYIKPEESGILCDPDNWYEMVVRTVELLQNREERRRLGKAGRLTLLERFSWKILAERLENFYNKTISI